MKKAIIHISDLHVCLHEDLKGNLPKDGIKSWLTTNPEDKYSKEYINSFCSYIKTKYIDYDFSLVITGDIANESDEQEYIYALKYLSLLVSEIKIDIDKILLLPGDHDINRSLNLEAFKSGKLITPDKKSYEYNEKYNNFGNFYTNFLGNKFDETKAVVSFLDFIDEKLLILGLNSNFCIDYEGGEGYIDIEILRNELKNLNPIYNEYSKIVSFHPKYMTKIYKPP